MSGRRLALTIPAAVLWLVGAFLMQSAVDEHMAFALAAVLSALIGIAVLIVPVYTLIAVSSFLSVLFAVAAAWLALIEWDWQALAAAVAYGLAGALSVLVLRGDHAAATAGGASGGPSAAVNRRYIPAYRLTGRTSTTSGGDDAGGPDPHP